MGALETHGVKHEKVPFLNGLTKWFTRAAALVTAIGILWTVVALAMNSTQRWLTRDLTASQLRMETNFNTEAMRARAADSLHAAMLQRTQEEVRGTNIRVSKLERKMGYPVRTITRTVPAQPKIIYRDRYGPPAPAEEDEEGWFDEWGLWRKAKP